jgi:radical SAM superfamily enzyme YgiQ (UPF0313 family)
MLGLPTETEDEMWDTIDLNVRMRADIPRAVIFTPFPGTKIVDIAKRHKQLDADFDCQEIPASSVSGTVLEGVDSDRILSTLYLFQTAVLFPRWRGAVRRVARMPPNAFLRLWFYLVYAWSIYAYFYRTISTANLFRFMRVAFASRKSQI